MPKCKIFKKCPVSTGELEIDGFVKNYYCNNNFMECARYKIYKKLGKASVPTDLKPIDFDIEFEMTRS